MLLLRQHSELIVILYLLTDYAKKCCIPYKGTFGDHFVQGIVVGINHTDKIIELENGESVAFDIAVLATGSKGPLPFKNGLVLSSEEYVTRAEAIHVEVSSRLSKLFMPL